MKYQFTKAILSVLLGILIFVAIAFAQTNETIDIISFTAPGGWQKEVSQNAFQLGGENEEGACIISILKPIPANSISRVNFDAAWKTFVKETMKVSGEPEMSPAETKDGWTTESGFANYENNGIKGAAILVNMSDGTRMVNILILMNSAAFQKDVEDFLLSVQLPKLSDSKTASTHIPPPNTSIIDQRSGFQFSTSNFDDGWTSTEREDWVEVLKGNVKVLIHYPREGTIFPADPEPLTNAAWNILVAPRYSNLKNYKTAYITTSNRPYLGMGSAIDNASGKQVFIVLFRQGNSGWLEFIAPDKNGFVQQFKFDPETIKWDSDSDLLMPLTNMVNYNKFAIAASDFSGTWTSDFSGVQQMYQVYTGSYAGMNINQSKEEFVFGAGNTYNWKLLVVSGMVGNIKYANVSSTGKYTVLNNWQIQFSKIESGAKTYNAFWSSIKNARVLKLLDAKNQGSGIYTAYGKK